MKKIISLFVLVMILISVAACRTTTTTGTTTGTATNQQPITLTYASWNVGDPNSQSPNLERLMLDAFEARYPHITVQVIERPKMPDPNNAENQIDTPWNEFLAAQAAAKQFPDVFLPDNIPLSIKNGWVRNVTDIAAADPEFNNVSNDITNAGKYEGKVLVLPLSAHYFGFLVNKSIFNNANKNSPTFGVTWEQLVTSVKSVAQHRSGGNGIVGFEGVEHIMHWYPAQLKPEFGWFTYDGSKLNLTDPAFRTAVELQHDLYTDKSFVLESLTGDEQKDYFGEGWMWGLGRHAVKFDGSWAISGLKADMEADRITDFEFDFIGTPSVNGVQRIPIALDFIAVSSTTKYPQEAYNLAKWMGFGKEGYAKRLELSTTVEGINPINFAPLQPDEQLLNSFFDVYEGFDNFRKVVEHGDYIVEPVKFLPGYIPARYTAQYDAENNMWSIFNKLMRNEITFADHIAQINQKANEELTKAYNEIKSAIK